MTTNIKKLLSLFVLCFLHTQVNLVASKAPYLKRVAENIDRIILRPGLWQINIHEAGHITQSVQYPSSRMLVGYTTTIPTIYSHPLGGKRLFMGHMYSIQLPDKKYMLTYDEAINEVKIALAGAAAEHVYNNRELFTDNNDILKYLQNPCYRGDMEAAKTTTKFILEWRRSSQVAQGINPKNIQPVNDFAIDNFIADMYKQTYNSQLQQKNNTLTIASQLINKQTIAANDIYKALNTYTYTKTSPQSTLTTYGDNISIEKRFYASDPSKPYSKARYENGNFVDVTYYQENGLPIPKYSVDKDKQLLLLRTHSQTKITTQEHELNGSPKIGPAVSKNYKYRFDNNLQEIGFKGGFDQFGRDRKGNLAELD